MHASLQRLIALAESGIKRSPVIGLSAIANVLGESPQTLNNWKRRGVSAQAAATAAEAFGGTASHILEGTPIELGITLSSGVAQDMSQIRPIVSLPKTTLGKLDMGEKFNQPFELDVADDALAPEIFKGCIAMLDPNRRPEPGWPVLVRDRDGKHYLRDYKVGAGTKWSAVPRPGQAHMFDPLDNEVHGLTVVASMDGYRRPKPT